MTQPLSAHPPIATASVIPTLNPHQMQEVLRLMVEEYGLGQSLMLETTGRALMGLARRLVGGNLAGQKLSLLAGAGNCGAAGLVAARLLTAAGAEVNIILSRPPASLDPTTLHQYRLLNRIGQDCYHQLPTMRLTALLRGSALIVDALIGGGLHDWASGSEAFLIQALRQAGRPVLSLDLPSGLAPTGELPARLDSLAMAGATLALALPRQAHVQPAALPYLGDLYLADIGIPPSVYTRLGLNVGALFNQSDLLLLRAAPH